MVKRENEQKRGSGDYGRPRNSDEQTAPNPAGDVQPALPAQTALNGAVRSGDSGSPANGPIGAGASSETASTAAQSSRKKESGWHREVTTWVAVATLLFALFFNYKSNEGLQTQIRMQRESQEQSKPIGFDVETRRLPNGDPQLAIRNLGGAEIVGVRTDFNYYFVFANGQIRSRPGVQKLLRADPIALKACRANNLLVRPDDVPGLLGNMGEFRVQYMVSGEVFEPEISQSSILNAVRLAHALNARAMMRWRFEYQHRVSHERFTSYLFVLIQPTAATRAIEARPGDIFDLSRTVGGKVLINAIMRFEESSLEVFFPNSNRSDYHFGGLRDR
jgi:hypothetical protein